MEHDAVKFGLPGIDEHLGDSFVSGIYIVKTNNVEDENFQTINRIKKR